MKKFMIIFIGLVAILSINATTIQTTIPPTKDKTYTKEDFLTLTEERLYEEMSILENIVDSLENKVEVSQEIIYLLIELGNKYPEFNNDIYDVLFEMDIAEYAYDLDIRFFRDDTIENKAEQDYIEIY